MDIVDDYVNRSYQVLAAGKRLQSKLASSPSEWEAAIDMLETAVSEQSDISTRAQYFTAPDVSDTRSDNSAHVVKTTDALESSLTDIAIANMLISADQAIPGAPEAEQSSEFPANLERLQGVLDKWRSERQGAPLPQSLNGPDEREGENAAARYELQLNKCLDMLESQIEKVFENTLAAMRKINPDAITKAFSGVIDGRANLEGHSRLISLAILKLQQVYASLSQLFQASEASELLRKIHAAWNKLIAQATSGDNLNYFINIAIEPEKTRSLVKTLLASTSASDDQINGGILKLEGLSASLAKTIGIMLGIVAAISLTPVILPLAHIAVAAPTIAGLYVLVLLMSLLIGMDYADTTQLYVIVNGVRVISVDTLK